MQWGASSRLQRFWDLRAACNFIGGGTGTSLLVWAALGLLVGLPYFHAALSGLALIGAGLFMVWLEIGKPWRAFNVFFRPQTSWMTREGVVAIPLFAVGAIAVLLDTGLELPVGILSPLVPAILAAFLSLVFLYCQLRILNSARGLPAWREPRAMLVLGMSGLTEGMGLYLVITALLGRFSIVITSVMLVLLVARALAWRDYIARLNRDGTPEATLSALGGLHKLFLAAGHGLPIVLLGLTFVWPDTSTTLAALAGIAATLAGWWFKIILVTKAAYIPGIQIPVPPIRGSRGPSNGVQRAIKRSTT